MAIRLITGRLQQGSRYCAKNYTKFYRKLHAVYITIDGCHYVWQKAQTAILHCTRGRLTDQRRNQTQECRLTFLSEIAAQDSRDTLCPGHRCFEECHFSSAELERWSVSRSSCVV